MEHPHHHQGEEELERVSITSYLHRSNACIPSVSSLPHSKPSINPRQLRGEVEALRAEAARLRRSGVEAVAAYMRKKERCDEVGDAIDPEVNHFDAHVYLTPVRITCYSAHGDAGGAAGTLRRPAPLQPCHGWGGWCVGQRGAGSGAGGGATGEGGPAEGGRGGFVGGGGE